MRVEFMFCISCNEVVEVKIDGDNASMCPECRDIDSFIDLEDADIEMDE